MTQAETSRWRPAAAAWMTSALIQQLDRDRRLGATALTVQDSQAGLVITFGIVYASWHGATEVRPSQTQGRAERAARSRIALGD